MSTRQPEHLTHSQRKDFLKFFHSLSESKGSLQSVRQYVSSHLAVARCIVVTALCYLQGNSHISGTVLVYP
jgi:hypothetical protein